MKRFGFFASAMVAAACFVVAAVGVAQGGAAAAATASSAPAAGADPVPNLLKSPADVARGKAIFVGTCGAYCHHMTNTAGDAPFLFDCYWIHGGSDQEIFHTITTGVPGTRMVPFKGAIPDADLWRVVAYLKSASQCKQ
jgi:cytochrome c oxidase cbb3-type subunit 3